MVIWLLVVLWVAFRMQWRRRVHYHTLWGPVLSRAEVHASLRELLIELDRVLTGHVEWWLDAGSLLGAWREGALIPWDDDVDVAIRQRDHERVLALEFRAPFRLVQVSRGWSLDKLVPFMVRLVGPSSTFLRLLDTRTQLYVDILEFGEDEGLLRLLPLSWMHPHPTHDHKPFRVSRETVFPLGRLPMEGVHYPCPALPQAYLERMYGSDLSPDHRWDGRRYVPRAPVTMLSGGLSERPTTGGEAYNRQVYDLLRERGHAVRHLQVYWLRSLTLLGLLPVVGPPLASLILAPFLALVPGMLIEDEHCTAHLIGTNWLRRLLGRGRVVIIVHHMADYRSERASPWSRWQQWARLAAADLVVCNSAHTRDEVLSLGVPAVVVEPGIDPALKGERAVGEGRLELLAVGNCVPRKGFDVLLRALALVPPGSMRLRVAGDIRGSHYRDVLRPLTGPDVGFEGRVSPERLRELYASSHALVLPSLQEGYSIVVSEAFHCGLQVVASDLPAVRDRVPEGLRFPPGDADGLARILVGLRPVPARAAVDARVWAKCRAEFWEVVRAWL